MKVMKGKRRNGEPVWAPCAEESLDTALEWFESEAEAERALARIKAKDSRSWPGMDSRLREYLLRKTHRKEYCGGGIGQGEDFDIVAWVSWVPFDVTAERVAEQQEYLKDIIAYGRSVLHQRPDGMSEELEALALEEYNRRVEAGWYDE